jgi:protoporphyrinogen oxidase
MLVEDRLRSIPSQLNFLELLLSAPRLLFLKKQGQSVRDYYSKIVGTRNFDKVFAHLFSAVPSQCADDFPADILFKRRQRRKDVIRSFTFPNGLQAITDAVAAGAGIELAVETEATRIEAGGPSFEVQTTNGERYSAEFLALATSPAVGAQLVRQVYPKVAEELARIRTTTVETVGVALAKGSVAVEEFAGVVPSGDSFYSVVSRDTVPHDEYRGFTFHFKGDQLDLDAKLDRIAMVLRTPRKQLDLVTTKQNVLPSFRLGHENRVASIDRLLADKRLLLTGNYLRGMSIEDCVLRSASEFKRLGTRTESVTE